MSSPGAARPPGSRSTAYVVAGVVATVPVFFVLLVLLGAATALGVVVLLWVTGAVYLAKKRQEEPAWDASPVTRQR